MAEYIQASKMHTLPFNGSVKRLYIARGRVPDDVGLFLESLHGTEAAPGVQYYVFDGHLGVHMDENLDVRLFLERGKKMITDDMAHKPWMKTREVSGDEKERVLQDIRNNGNDTLLFFHYMGGSHIQELKATGEAYLHIARTYGFKKIGMVCPSLPDLQSDRFFEAEYSIPLFETTARKFGDVADWIFSFVYHSNANIAYTEKHYPGKFCFLSPAFLFAEKLKQKIDLEKINDVLFVSVDGGNKLYLENPETGDYLNMPASVARNVELINAYFETDIPTDVPFHVIENHPLIQNHLLVMDKRRPDKNDETSPEIQDDPEALKALVAGRLCIIHDDKINTAGSAIVCAEKLRQADACKVYYSARDASLPILENSPVEYPKQNSRYTFVNAVERLFLSDDENARPLIDHVFLLHSLRKLPEMIVERLNNTNGKSNGLSHEQRMAALQRYTIINPEPLFRRTIQEFLYSAGIVKRMAPGMETTQMDYPNSALSVTNP